MVPLQISEGPVNVVTTVSRVLLVQERTVIASSPVADRDLAEFLD